MTRANLREALEWALLPILGLAILLLLGLDGVS